MGENSINLWNSNERLFLNCIAKSYQLLLKAWIHVQYNMIKEYSDKSTLTRKTMSTKNSEGKGGIVGKF